MGRWWGEGGGGEGSGGGRSAKIHAKAHKQKKTNHAMLRGYARSRRIRKVQTHADKKTTHRTGNPPHQPTVHAPQSAKGWGQGGSVGGMGKTSLEFRGFRV